MEAVHGALREAFRILPGDRNVRLMAHAPHRFACPPHLAQPELYTHVSIDAFAGRSLDAKRALYRGIVENLARARHPQGPREDPAPRAPPRELGDPRRASRAATSSWGSRSTSDRGVFNRRGRSRHRSGRSHENHAACLRDAVTLRGRRLRLELHHPGSGTGGSVGTGGCGPGTRRRRPGPAARTGGQDGAADGPVLYTLTVQNYLDWCDVTENSTVYPASVPPVMSFAPGTVVNVNAEAATVFVWGYWTGTDGDTTSAHDTSMTTTVTMTSNKTILACCPFPPPAPTCPRSDHPRRAASGQPASECGPIGAGSHHETSHAVLVRSLAIAALFATACTSSAGSKADASAGATGGRRRNDGSGQVASQVVNDGFVTAGPWAGYGFTATDPGAATITPDCSGSAGCVPPFTGNTFLHAGDRHRPGRLHRLRDARLERQPDGRRRGRDLADPGDGRHHRHRQQPRQHAAAVCSCKAPIRTAPPIAGASRSRAASSPRGPAS